MTIKGTEAGRSGWTFSVGWYVSAADRVVLFAPYVFTRQQGTVTHHQTVGRQKRVLVNIELKLH